MSYGVAQDHKKAAHNAVNEQEAATWAGCRCQMWLPMPAQQPPMDLYAFGGMVSEHCPMMVVVVQTLSGLLYPKNRRIKSPQPYVPALLPPPSSTSQVFNLKLHMG